MACGAAQTLEQMVAFRFLQGISAAFIGPLSQSVMLDINPPERHARAMSIWGMGIMIGPILGPILGSALQGFGLRVPFFIYAGAVFAAALVVMVFLRGGPGGRPTESCRSRKYWRSRARSSPKRG